MLIWKRVTRQLQTEDDKACVCFITTSWKISTSGKAAAVDSEDAHSKMELMMQPAF